MTLYPVLILLLLGFILWIRSEMKHAPTKDEDKGQRKGEKR